MLNLRTGKNDLAPVALTRRDSIKGLAAILAAGCAPAIASAAARGNARMGGMRGAAAAATYDYYDGVEYLESSGTQYIDTGLLIDNDLEFSIDAQVTASGTSIGGNVTSGSDYYRFTFGYRNNVVTGTYYSFFGGSGDNHGYSSNAFAILRHLFEFKDSAFYIDNTKIANKDSHYLSNDYGITYALYGCRSKSGVSLMGGSIVWSAVFSKAGELYHFVPVLHEGAGKMLDLCHNKLYSNAGTGSFTVGPSKGVIVVPKQGFGANTPSI